jgi:drug/metabolite transporter (DMT)-like permease
MTPVFGVMLAMLLLGERLTPVNLLGSGMVLAATVLVMRYDAGADRQPAGGG